MLGLKLDSFRQCLIEEGEREEKQVTGSVMDSYHMENAMRQRMAKSENNEYIEMGIVVICSLGLTNSSLISIILQNGTHICEWGCTMWST